MAYVANLNNQEGEDQQGETNPYLTPESGQFGPNANNENIQTGSQPLDKGGASYTDISKFISANAPQEKRLAAKVGQQAVSEAESAKSQLRNAQSQYGNDISSNTLNYDPNRINQIASNPLNLFDWQPPPPPPPPDPGRQTGGNRHGGGHPGGNQGYYYGGNNPNYFTNRSHQGGNGPGPNPPPPPPSGQYAPGTLPIANQGDYDYIQNINNASYQGPTGIEGNQAFQGAQDQAVNAIQAAENTKGDVSRLDALRKLAGQNYGAGSGMFDNALLNTGAAKNVLDKDRSQSAGLNDQFGTARQNASEAAQNAAASYPAAQGYVQNAFFGPQGFYPTLQGQIQPQVTTGHGHHQTTTGGITPEQEAKIQALNQLMGTNYTW